MGKGGQKGVEEEVVEVVEESSSLECIPTAERGGFIVVMVGWRLGSFISFWFLFFRHVRSCFMFEFEL